MADSNNLEIQITGNASGLETAADRATAALNKLAESAEKGSHKGKAAAEAHAGALHQLKEATRGAHAAVELLSAAFGAEAINAATKYSKEAAEGFEHFKEQVEQLMAVFGEQLTPALKSLGDLLKGVRATLMENDGELLKQITHWGGIAVAFLGAVAGGKQLLEIYKGISGAIELMGGPITILIGLFTILGIVVVKNWDKIRYAILDNISTIANKLADFAEATHKFTGGALSSKAEINFLRGVGQNSSTYANNPDKPLTDMLPEGIKGAIESFKSNLQGLTGVFDNIIEKGKTIKDKVERKQLNEQSKKIGEIVAGYHKNFLEKTAAMDQDYIKQEAASRLKVAMDLAESGEAVVTDLEDIDASMRKLSETVKDANSNYAIEQMRQREQDTRNQQVQNFQNSPGVGATLSIAGHSKAGGVINAGMQGYQSGGFWGMLINVFGELLTMTKNFNKSMKVVNYTMDMLASILNPIVDSLMMMTAAMNEMLGPAFKILGIVVGFLTDIVLLCALGLYKSFYVPTLVIGSAVLRVVAWIEGVIGDAENQHINEKKAKEMHDQALQVGSMSLNDFKKHLMDLADSQANAADAMDGAADAANQFSSSLENVPSIFNAERAAFLATMAGVGGGVAGSSSGGVAGANGNGNQYTTPDWLGNLGGNGGSVNITVEGNVYETSSFAKVIKESLDKLGFTHHSSPVGG